MCEEHSVQGELVLRCGLPIGGSAAFPGMNCEGRTRHRSRIVWKKATRSFVLLSKALYIRFSVVFSFGEGLIFNLTYEMLECWSPRVKICQLGDVPSGSGVMLA